MIISLKVNGKYNYQCESFFHFSFTDANETSEMHTKSDNITIMMVVETKDIINELFNTFHKRYQEELEKK